MRSQFKSSQRVGTTTSSSTSTRKRDHKVTPFPQSIPNRFQDCPLVEFTLKGPRILFHGGGWRRGDPSQFRTACAYFASRELVCATVGYQLPDQDAIKDLPAGQSYKRLCITDAKSAIRWFKANAHLRSPAREGWRYGEFL